MKKICLCIIIFSLFSNISCDNASAQTADSSEHNNYFNGFYFGVGIGAFCLKDNDKNSLFFPRTGIEYYPIEQNKGNYSEMLNIFAGYGRTISENLYLGAEIFGRYHPINSDFNYIAYTITYMQPDNQLTYESKIQLNFSYGILLRGGYLVTPRTLTYVLLGYKNIHLDIDGSMSHKISTYSPTYYDRSLTKVNTSGLMGGFGIETYIAGQLTIRAQDTYTMHKKFKEKNIFNLEEVYIDKHLHDTRQNTFSLDIIYHFT